MLKITIPQPCHEDWDKMLPNPRGRHCNACAKTVVDFSIMSDVEVQQFFINKNVLLSEINIYSSFMKKGAQLLLSGFYTKDIDDLKKEAARYGLTEISRDEKEEWANLLLQK